MFVFLEPHSFCLEDRAADSWRFSPFSVEVSNVGPSLSASMEANRLLCPFERLDLFVLGQPRSGSYESPFGFLQAWSCWECPLELLAILGGEVVPSHILQPQVARRFYVA